MPEMTTRILHRRAAAPRPLSLGTGGSPARTGSRRHSAPESLRPAPPPPSTWSTQTATSNFNTSQILRHAGSGRGTTHGADPPIRGCQGSRRTTTALGGAPWRRTCFPGTRGSVDPRRAVFPGWFLRGDGPAMFRSWKMQFALTSSMVVAVQGGGSSEPSGVDFPSVQGILPFQGSGEVVRRRAGVTFSLPSPASGSRRK